MPPGLSIIAMDDLWPWLTATDGKATPLIVDVRSPAEYAEDHIPGAVNFPVLDDDERATIGTLHKNSPRAAKLRGAGLISANIGRFWEDFCRMAVAPGVTVVIHCWRGGLRSRSLATIAHMAGIPCKVLEGGYKTWRRRVMDFFAAGNYPRALVLQGPSGSGKTETLRDLARRESGYTVIDLEGLANHRGSALGADFQTPQPSQKMFESALAISLARAAIAGRFILLEAESSRIGRISIPPGFFRHMRASRHISLLLPLAIRAERLAREYYDPDYRATILARLEVLRPILGGQMLARIAAALGENDSLTAARLLLENHYDPLYMRHIDPSNEAGATGFDRGDYPNNLAALEEHLSKGGLGGDV